MKESTNFGHGEFFSKLDQMLQKSAQHICRFEHDLSSRTIQKSYSIKAGWFKGSRRRTLKQNKKKIKKNKTDWTELSRRVNNTERKYNEIQEKLHQYPQFSSSLNKFFDMLHWNEKEMDRIEKHLEQYGYSNPTNREKYTLRQPMTQGQQDLLGINCLLLSQHALYM
ncbi:hypothetical protein RFI_10493, partial [Reticulomyxa filosa]